MKIAVFADGLFPYVIGGMQTFTSLSARQLAEEGVPCHVFYVNQPCYPDAATVHHDLFADMPTISLYQAPANHSFVCASH